MEAKSDINTLYTNNYYFDMNVLKVKIAGQRYRYEVMHLMFETDSDWLTDPNELKKGDKRDTYYFNDDRLDISDYEQYDYVDAGVAIRSTGEIYYELGDLEGKMPMNNVLCSQYHPILAAHRNAIKYDGLSLTSATVYDMQNTMFEYTLEVADRDAFDASLLEVITIIDPIMEEEEYVVEVRYDGKKMKGGAEGIPFGEVMSEKHLLTMPKEYAKALNLLPVPESRNILKFDDFVKEENQKDRKKPNKVKSVKEYNEAILDGYVKIREDYIHSFIDEHERGVEPEEEE